MQSRNESLAQFREEGYVVRPAFFTEREVHAMDLELQRLRQAGQLRNVTTDGDGTTPSQTAQNLQICPMHLKSTLYRALAFHPRVVETVSALIGDPFVRHLDQSFLKPARSGAPTNWHQDNAYFRVSDPLKGVGMWIAVHEANAANGTMRIIRAPTESSSSTAGTRAVTTTSAAGPPRSAQFPLNCPPVGRCSSPTERPTRPAPTARTGTVRAWRIIS